MYHLYIRKYVVRAETVNMYVLISSTFKRLAK